MFRLGFGSATNVICPFKLQVVEDSCPLDVAIVTHGWSDDTDHDVFDIALVTSRSPESAAVHCVWDKVNSAVTPGWVTLTDCVATDDPVVVKNITVADRGDMVELALATRVTDPPSPPVSGVIPTHESLDDADHDVFEVTVTGIDPPSNGTGHDVCDNDNDGVIDEFDVGG
ncbi:MAG: hypothetical protein FWF25_04450 [Propionibacteriaceae bacterium]|nr:hypothetical protein [Propionibacteriaceae bacterium]